VAVTDLTADMLTKLRNASRAHKETVELKRSKVIMAICDILKKEGFIANYKPLEDNRQGLVKVYLKYNKDSRPAITGLKRISRPGLKAYKGCTELPRVLGGVGIALVSTNQGIMTATEARSKRVGGEIMCYAW